MVVDDEVPLAEVVASYLTRELFDVTLAHHGADALALALLQRGAHDLEVVAPSLEDAFLALTETR